MNELTSDRYWIYFTAIIYWTLVVCWLAIIVFYFRQYGRFKRIYPLLTTLLIVLIIDGTRTLVESIYFGARYVSQEGLGWPSLYPLLDQPHFVAIPKGLNLIAALIIILVIVGRWFRSLEDEMQAQRLWEWVKNQRKMGRLPVMGFGQMVKTCREIIRRWPESEYAFYAKRALGEIPERYRKMYNITKEETDLGNLK